MLILLLVKKDMVLIHILKLLSHLFLLMLLVLEVENLRLVYHRFIMNIYVE